MHVVIINRQLKRIEFSSKIFALVTHRGQRKFLFMSKFMSARRTGINKNFAAA